MEEPVASKHTLEAAGNIIALAATACFLLSVLYDWGFFYALHISFGQAPTTITDHVRSAIVWLPETFVVIVLFVTVSPWPAFQLCRRVQVPTEENSVEPGARPLSSMITICAVAAIVLLCVWVLFGDNWLGGFAAPLIAFWGYLYLRGTEHFALRDRVSRRLSRAIFWIPIVCILVFTFGYIDARSIARAEGPIARVYMKQTPSAAPIEVKILRQFERVIFASDKSGAVVLLRSDEVYRIENLAHIQPYRGVVCKYFGTMCPK